MAWAMADVFEGEMMVSTYTWFSSISNLFQQAVNFFSSCLGKFNSFFGIIAINVVEIGPKPIFIRNPFVAVGNAWSRSNECFVIYRSHLASSRCELILVFPSFAGNTWRFLFSWKYGIGKD